MTARRQPSSTSLSNFTRANPAEFSGRSPNDFCNAFWGSGDGGFSVLSARMRGAMRTMEELKNFWKERCVSLSDLDRIPSQANLGYCATRAIIEEQYARRLSALAQFTLGKDEIKYAMLIYTQFVSFVDLCLSAKPRFAWIPSVSRQTGKQGTI